MHVVDRLSSGAGEAPVFTINQRFRFKFATFEPHADGYHFHHRTGLARRLDGRVHAPFEIFRGWPLNRRIKIRKIGDRENFAVGRIHHHRASALSGGFANAFFKRTFSDVLDDILNCQGNVGTLLTGIADPGHIRVL